jgi:hypothetical protein
MYVLVHIWGIYCDMYTHFSATPEIRAQNNTVLQEVFSMWSAPRPLLDNGSLNTFPQKRTVE